MKFPRNARIFRGRLDVAPFAAVFFLLMLFLFLASIAYTPGVALQLPMADDLPGLNKPAVHVAVDGNGTFYYRNQMVSEEDLSKQLVAAAQTSPELILVVQADKSVTYEQIVRLTMLAKGAGISGAWLATLPRAAETGSTAKP